MRPRAGHTRCVPPRPAPSLTPHSTVNAVSPAQNARLSALAIHPVKSGGALALDSAELVETGLDLDRTWMVVDRHGDMLTQRELPRMALIRPTLRGGELVLRAPGMLALHLQLDTVEAPTRVRVWDDIVKAWDMGALAAQWFSDFLGPVAGAALRLVRFDPDEERLSSARWTGTLKARNTFSDGYPLLVANAASLADLNQRLAAAGHTPVGMARFRPNLVLDGLAPWDEDHLHEIDIDTGAGIATLRLVKPCVRCSMPDVDPATAETGTAVAQTLAGFRADPRLNGGLTFGINAVVVAGAGLVLRTGQPVAVRHAFG
jgi:uncharacterized protein YcbX